MQSIDEQVERADFFWGYLISTVRIGAYVVIGLTCLNYDGPQHFLHGYFAADLIAHLFVIGRYRSARSNRTWFELLGYLALAVWLFGFGDPIPDQPEAAGMAAIA